MDQKVRLTPEQEAEATVQRLLILREMVKKLFGKAVKELVQLGLKDVYKLTLEDDTIIKARYHPGKARWNEYCRFLLDRGLNIPKILNTAPADIGNVTFTEWIEGTCYGVKSLNNRETLRAIPPRHYRLMGEFVASVSNQTYHGNRMSVHNVIWPQYVIDKNEKLWLIDPETLYADGSPERWIIYEILCHPYTTREQREGFIEGYLSEYEPREFNLALEMVEKFIKGIRRKNESNSCNGCNSGA